MKTFQLALVTGASTGLGKALCEALAARDIPLICVARDTEKLQQLARTLKVPTHIYSVDLTQAAERKKFLSWLSSHAPDLIINNAGIGLYGSALSHSTEKQSEIVELNVQALVEVALESAHTLLKHNRQGTILNVSSAAAFFLYPSHCIYAATKGFVNQFSESLDFELKPHHIRVLAACPGLIDTGFSLRASQGTPHKKSVLWTMSPEKVARCILKQIDRGRCIEIIDFRYKCFVAMSKLLPKALKMRIMNATLQDRIQETI